MLQHKPTHRNIITDAWNWEKYRQTPWTSHLNLLSVALPQANTLTLAAGGDSYKQKSHLKHLVYVLI